MLTKKIGKIYSRAAIFFNLIMLSNTKIFYVVEPADWAIKSVGLNLRRYIDKFTVTFSVKGIKNRIVHFGSANLFFNDWARKVDNSNKIILSWFHLGNDSNYLKRFISEIDSRAQIIHTSNSTTKTILVNLGFREEKVIVIPLGVDLNLFQPSLSGEKLEMRKKLNLPLNQKIIGSFQKDGVGWGKGLEPKLVKGPDTLCDVIERLARKYSIYVFLTGPARGYVKRRLTKAGVPFTHHYLDNHSEIVNYYKVLDLYLVTSRAEGGPKALLESWATGVPVVSTKVGMAADLIDDGVNGFLADVEGTDQLVNRAEKILGDETTKQTVIRNALQKVINYDWKLVAARYLDLIYNRFL